MTIFVTSPTELSTAATDLILALMAFGCLALISFSFKQQSRTRLWQGLFASLGISSLLGAIAHGIQMDLALNNLLWHPLYFFLGLTLTLLAAIAIHELSGETVARRFLPWLLPAPFIVVAIIWAFGGSFIYFILFEALIMVFVLSVYSYLRLKKAVPGAGLILAGVLFSIIAAGLQASGPFTFRVFFLFDHNGLFHLVQMVGVFCFFLGAKKGLGSS